MKIYTKTGDKGTTALIGGHRVAKHHIRINTYGTIDELNSWLGLIRDQEIDQSHLKTLHTIQYKLFTLGALLASGGEEGAAARKKSRPDLPLLKEGDIKMLEDEIDRMNEVLEPMTHFILPGGHATVSYCHIARTVCRRAERHISQLHELSSLDEQVLVYVNRLSDYLFVLARAVAKDLGINEIKWIPGEDY